MHEVKLRTLTGSCIYACELTKPSEVLATEQNRSDDLKPKTGLSFIIDPDGYFYWLVIDVVVYVVVVVNHGFDVLYDIYMYMYE